MAKIVKPDHEDVRVALHAWVDRMCDEAVTLNFQIDNEIVRDRDAEREQNTSYQINVATGRHTASVEWMTEEGLRAD